MATFKVARWGNSLAVRIPGALAKQAALQEGTEVDLAVNPDGDLVVRAGRKRYSIESLVRGLTPAKGHPEVDWGPKRGREEW